MWKWMRPRAPVPVRLSREGRGTIESAVQARRMRTSTFIPVSALTAATGVPSFLPTELIALLTVKEQLHFAGVNLNTLLRDLQFVRLRYEPRSAVTQERIEAVMSDLMTAVG